MPAVNYDIAIEQGASYSVSFEWREDDGSNPPTGPLIDTTNYEPKMQVRLKAGGTLIVAFDSASGLTVDDGVITLRIGADVTETIDRAGVYDIEMHNTADPTDVVRLVQGRVTPSADITRDDIP